jgi:hypothetical protein
LGADHAKMIIADGNFDGMLTVISPEISTEARSEIWMNYE